LSSNFEDTLIDIFSGLSAQNFKVNLETHYLFVCGGKVSGLAPEPLSFRDHLFHFTASKFPNIHDTLVQAETFKDYFKENAYPDLLIFEEEIANLASLVVIFLESPGSLVELGMFCTKPNFFKKLLIVAPKNEVSSEDSFIYLGPLENIKKKEPTSVVVYPWPSVGEQYEKIHLEDLCSSIQRKIEALPKRVEFDSKNSGHIALLIAEIIRVCYPIIITEIELVLLAMNVDIKQSEVSRHLYLLRKLEIIDYEFYSTYKYYYPRKPDNRFLTLGKYQTGRPFDLASARFNITQSLTQENDEQSKKRRYALKSISEIQKGAKK